MYRKIKETVFEIIQPAANAKTLSKIFDLIIMALIFLSVSSVFAMTFKLQAHQLHILKTIEKYTLFFFSGEYLLRIWTADLLFPSAGRIKSRLRYMTSAMAVIDLLAILPILTPLLPTQLVSFRAFRLLRLLRLFKINRYSDALALVGETFKRKGREIAASMFFVFILLIIASLFIYYAEHEAQPEQFTNAFSGLWWAVATLTTVGYGDIYPVTVLGKVLGAVIAIMGIGMVAIPTGILSAGFVENLEKKNPHPAPVQTDSSEHSSPPNYCPHCGKKL